MLRTLTLLTVVVMSSCAYPGSPEVGGDTAMAQGIELPGGRGQDELPVPTLPERELVTVDEALSGRALREAPGVDAASVEEQVEEALRELPELAENVSSFSVRETDAGLMVRGVVTSQEASDDVLDLVTAAAPGAFVENDLVVVVDLPMG